MMVKRYQQLLHIFKYKNVHRLTKLQIYKTIITLVSYFRHETWVFTKANEKFANIFEWDILTNIFALCTKRRDGPRLWHAVITIFSWNEEIACIPVLKKKSNSIICLNFAKYLNNLLLFVLSYHSILYGQRIT